jgi:peptidoglycan/xylan/chitin deacetylase (PgdA/CDA1 family)
MTLFVSTEHITEGTRFHHDVRKGRGDFRPLTWDELRIMRDEGFEIGSHTRTHFDCGSTDVAVLREEIAGSRLELERRLGIPIESFSFPFGLRHNMSAEAVKIAEENYKYVFSAYGGTNFAPPTGRVKHLRRWFHANDLWELELTMNSLLDAPGAQEETPAELAPSRRLEAAGGSSL